MEMATTGIPAPSDLTLDRMTLATETEEGKAWRKTEAPIPRQLGGSPNLSLLWHSFLPGGDATALDPGQLIPGTPDIARWTRYISGLPDRRLSREEKDQRQVNQETEKKNRKRTLEQWASAGRLDWFIRAAFKASDTDHSTCLWEELHARRLSAIKSRGSSHSARFRSRWRMAVGLGYPSSFENSGVTLHPTYGFPMIPATSLKGLVRHYLLEEFPYEDPSVPVTLSLLGNELQRDWGRLVSVLFGEGAGEAPEKGKENSRNDGASRSDSTPGSPSSANEGLIAWHDGWAHPHPEGWFEVDVLTPHHSTYYGGGNQSPDDTDNPIPAHFLTVRAGVEYDIPLSLTAVGRALPRPLQITILTFLTEVLIAALDRWGVGAKSGSGYGRMETA